MSNRFVVIVIALLCIFGGIFIATKHKANGPTTSNSNVAPTSHQEGQGQKHVTLIEYGDYQCPACGEYYPLMKQVFNKYQADITFQFRNFPITSKHPNAFAGARAAEAAAKQGKFWQMHDKLYDENVTYYTAQNQGQVYNTWITATDPTSYFNQYAQALGLDVTKFKQDFQSASVNDLINADINAANAIGTDATPTFALDGKKVSPTPQSLAAFNKLLDSEIAAKNK